MGRKYWELKKFLKEAQWWDRERIEAWQLNKLKSIVKYAYKNVPGYHLLYRDAGVAPDDITAIDKVKILPFITKELLRENLEDFTAKNIPSRKLKFVTTGGSTGTPFGFYQTEVNRWVENAFMHHGWEQVGWQLEDTSIVLRGSFTGTEDHFWDYDKANRKIHLSIYHLDNRMYSEYVGKIEEFKPQHLQAYPSAVTILADLILEHGDVGHINFKTTLLGSENIYEWQKEKLRKAFPEAKLFGWYGQSEQVILAPMCEYLDSYHLWPFYGLTEILNEAGDDVGLGTVGELVGTSFWNYGTPFIRYRTNDLALKGKRRCDECGRKFQLLDNIEGRMQDYVVTSDERYITLTGLIFAQHFHAFGVIKNMQLYQDKKGQVTVRVIPAEGFSKSDAFEIKEKIETAVNGKLKVQVKLVDRINRTQRGKYRFLEQKLNIRYEDKN
jgi:phenylacetate-CoA ligase